MIGLLDNIVTCRTYRNKRPSGIACGSKCANGGKFCCNFILCGNVNTAAALPVLYFAQFKAENLRTGARTPVKLFGLCAQRAAREIADFHHI